MCSTIEAWKYCHFDRHGRQIFSKRTRHLASSDRISTPKLWFQFILASRPTNNYHRKTRRINSLAIPSTTFDLSENYIQFIISEYFVVIYGLEYSNLHRCKWKSLMVHQHWKWLGKIHQIILWHKRHKRSSVVATLLCFNYVASDICLRCS